MERRAEAVALASRKSWGSRASPSSTDLFMSISPYTVGRVGFFVCMEGIEYGYVAITICSKDSDG